MLKILLAAGHGADDNRGGVCYNEGDNNYLYSLALKKDKHFSVFRQIRNYLFQKSICTSYGGLSCKNQEYD